MSKEMDRAVEFRNSTEKHYNCTQSLLCAFADKTGMTEEEAYKLGTHFGGGMKMGATCGAITGGLMILGLCGKGDVSYAQKYVDGFRDRHDGVLNCAELLRINAKKGGQRKPHCDGMIFEAVRSLEELLD